MSKTCRLYVPGCILIIGYKYKKLKFFSVKIDKTLKALLCTYFCAFKYFRFSVIYLQKYMYITPLSYKTATSYLQNNLSS